MGKRSRKGKTNAAPVNAPRPASTRSAQPASAVGVPPISLVLGTLFLVVSIVTAFMLSLDHLGGLSLPGCGPGSACAELASGKWGKIPLVNWPVSYFGLAYFLAALLAWLGSRRGVPTAFRHIVRLGVLGSVGFSIIMLVEQHLCQYCVGTHLGNLAFWIVLETARARAPRPAPLLAGAIGVFVLATAALGVAEWQVRRAVNERAETDRQQSTEEIIKASPPQHPTSTQSANPATQTAPAVSPRPATQSAPSTSRPDAATESDYPFKNGFRGRYLHGPEKAAVRLVLFTDYQCRDCKAKEAEIRQLLAQHNDISLSVKHFPFDTSCNPDVGRHLHDNACFAARAAEAAGILWGDKGFFAMHNWLFDHDGRFLTTQELESGIREIGYDPAGFVQIMTGDETERRVKADIEEGKLLGIFQTPMIFINGVELRGWNAPNAVIRTVEQVLARHPEPQTYANDRPPLAIGKCVGDWREQPVLSLPPDAQRRALGPDGAKVTIVLWGDYEEPTTAEADGIIRNWLAGRTDAQYVFRHFPFNQACNANVSSTLHERACWAAQVAEAAGRVAGPDAYWRVHTWLLKNQKSLTETALRQAAGELGVNVDVVLGAIQQPDVAAAIREDADAGKRVNLTNIPTIYINGKIVFRWRWLGPELGRKILEAVLNEAAAGK